MENSCDQNAQWSGPLVTVRQSESGRGTPINTPGGSVVSSPRNPGTPPSDDEALVIALLGKEEAQRLREAQGGGPEPYPPHQLRNSAGKSAGKGDAAQLENAPPGPVQGLSRTAEPPRGLLGGQGRETRASRKGGSRSMEARDRPGGGGRLMVAEG